MVPVLLLAAALVGCGSGGTSPAGPLEVLAASGATSIFAPARRPWSGIFGDFHVCVNGGDAVYLDSLSFSYKVAPVNPPRSVVRVLPLYAVGTTSAFGPLERLQRRPDREGDFESLAGFEVRIPCDGYERAPMQNEILIEYQTNGEGVWAEYATLNYHDADQNSYTARIPWQMILCGSAIEPDEDGHDRCDEEG